MRSKNCCSSGDCPDISLNVRQRVKETNVRRFKVSKMILPGSTNKESREQETLSGGSETMTASSPCLQAPEKKLLNLARGF